MTLEGMQGPEYMTPTRRNEPGPAGPDDTKSLRLPSVIYPKGRVAVMPTKMSDVERKAVWDTFFQQMSLFHHGAGKLMLEYDTVDVNHELIDGKQGNMHREQALLLSLMEQLHKTYDFFEADKNTTFNRGIGYFTRVSKRPYNLDGGDWKPYFDPGNYKHILVGRLFSALYNFLAQLHSLQSFVKEGRLELTKPIDAQWVSKMKLDACSAWDDLCWLEECYSPKNILRSRSYCLRPTINHPEGLSSHIGTPFNWIRRLIPPAVCADHCEENSDCESLDTTSRFSSLQIGTSEAGRHSLNGTGGIIACGRGVSQPSGPQGSKNAASPLNSGRQTALPVSEAPGSPYQSLSRKTSSEYSNDSPEKSNKVEQNKKLIDAEAQTLLEGVAKTMIAADKAKLDKFEASFKWARPAHNNHMDIKGDMVSEAPGYKPNGISPRTPRGLSDPLALEPLSPYGAFETAEYSKLPSPCGSFDNESYVTRLCHNEDSSVHVTEKPHKFQYLTKLFTKKDGTKIKEGDE